ncbi:mCG1026273, partial [Mus musculus]
RFQESGIFMTYSNKETSMVFTSQRFHLLLRLAHERLGNRLDLPLGLALLWGYTGNANE